LINKAKFVLFISFLISLVILFFTIIKFLAIILGFSILVALSISVINFLAFITAFEYSRYKSNKTFLLLNIGGMGVRLMLMLLLVFISIKFLKVDVVGFIFAFFICYIFMLIMEIFIINDNLRGRESSKK